MSGRVCYLARAPRTDGPAVVRLVSPASDEIWEQPGPPADAAEITARTRAAAAWVAERAARGDGPRNEIALMCVDVEGATCGWLTAPSADESVVSAVLSQGGGDWAGAGTDVGAAGGVWSPPNRNESTVQALAAAVVPRGMTLRPRKRAAATSEKLAVVAVPDVDARLFIDALDEHGVGVDRCVSLWHAAALAWDPAPVASSVRGDVVAVSAATTAVVVIDPAGRLIWAWSRQGSLLAAGTIRLVREQHDDAGTVVLGQQDVGRLTADWLSWSMQLGAAPARIVCVGPTTGEGHGGLSPAALGTALGRAWPGAAIDLAVHEDPLGATLGRLAGLEIPEGSAFDGRGGLVALSKRPGRAHRSLYHWGAIAIVAVAGLLGALGWQAFRAAGNAAAALRDSKAATSEAVLKLMKQSGRNLSALEQAKLEGNAADFLAEALAKKKEALNPNTGLEPAKPILHELDTLSYVLGTKEIEIDQIQLMNSGVIVYVSVPDTPTGEAIKAALDGVRDSKCDWRAEFGGGRRTGKQGVTLYGKWKTEAGARS